MEIMSIDDESICMFCENPYKIHGGCTNMAWTNFDLTLLSIPLSRHSMKVNFLTIFLMAGATIQTELPYHCDSPQQLRMRYNT